MILRPFNEADAVIWYNWYHDKRLAKYFRGYVYGVSIAQCTRAPEMMRGHILLGIDETTNKAVGAVNFCDTETVLRIYRMGLLTDPELHHQGVGKELSALAIDWAFNTMNAHKIICDIICDDTRMIQGLEYAGFTQYGVDKESMFIDGIIKDEFKYHLLRRDYVRKSDGQRAADGNT